MTEKDKPIDRLMYELKERAKELNCLYNIQELFNQPDATLDDICRGIVAVIPPGWQYPDVCLAKITLDDSVYQSPGFIETPWVQHADINVQEEILGRISVYYGEERPAEDEGPFLKEERRLIDTIAEQFGLHILHRQLRVVFQEQKKIEEERKSEWGVILDLLRRTDPKLLMLISRKMINYLYWKGVKEAQQLLEHLSPTLTTQDELIYDANRPFKSQTSETLLDNSENVFKVAGQHLSEDEILDNIQKWIKEDRSGFLVDTLVNPGSSLEEISSAIERYHHLASQGLELSEPREHWFRVALIRRILSDQPGYVEVAKHFIYVDDFSNFMQRVIYPSDSHGKLGGKSSGLFLAAQILNKSSQEKVILTGVKTPKTWYLTSDGIFYFMSYNNLEDIVVQKYMEVNQVRQEYPYVVNVFKNSPLPPEIVKGLSLALDDLGDVPLIVRSSSLLEDRTGTAFAGKYKSLFITNQGTKEERMSSLMDAIAEVYASMFSPDPVEYRKEHNLIDYHEEMGIMIQEVVGQQVGRYYFPAFAGIAFSNNEFNWSSRIKREDGLLRMVPGLGTRAVDRIGDDYPILIAPGQPMLRVNVTLDEIQRYSPKRMDVINLETGGFETVDIKDLLLECGSNYPLINQLVSILKYDHLQLPSAIGTDFEEDDFVVTFEGLASRSPFVQQMCTILEVLQETFGYPVDIEFAHDGSDFYILQCRAQSYSEASQPAAIPTEISHDRILFSANRYISNGTLSDISHIVYVDPQKYSQLSDHQELLAVGQAVGAINKLLPKRGFVLMGPGRWGSRGDIKSGVNVSYSDINNCAMLVEIARKRGDYIPDLSFGTHFFQDLVEASIRYLPLYPDNPGVIFNETFFEQSNNILPEILPEFAWLKDVIQVIDIPRSTAGKTLQILMNADDEQALALINE